MPACSGELLLELEVEECDNCLDNCRDLPSSIFPDFESATLAALGSIFFALSMERVVAEACAGAFAAVSSSTLLSSTPAARTTSAIFFFISYSDLAWDVAAPADGAFEGGCGCSTVICRVASDLVAPADGACEAGSGCFVVSCCGASGVGAGLPLEILDESIMGPGTAADAGTAADDSLLALAAGVTDRFSTDSRCLFFLSAKSGGGGGSLGLCAKSGGGGGSLGLFELDSGAAAAGAAGAACDDPAV